MGAVCEFCEQRQQPGGAPMCERSANTVIPAKTGGESYTVADQKAQVEYTHDLAIARQADVHIELEDGRIVGMECS
jgi:hypothetical protein